jgi:hypothetical protein
MVTNSSNFTDPYFLKRFHQQAITWNSITCVRHIHKVPASFLGRILCSHVSVIGLIKSWDELKYILKNVFYVLLKKRSPSPCLRCIFFTFERMINGKKNQNKISYFMLMLGRLLSLVQYNRLLNEFCHGASNF